MVAIAFGALILAIGGVLLWTSFTAAHATTNTPPIAFSDSAEELLASFTPKYSAVPEQAAAAKEPTVTEPLVIIHVAGHVAQPGIVEISSTSRVIDAVEEAGGALPEADLDRINLAAAVTDGSQIYVPAVDDAGAAPDPADHSRDTTQAAPPSLPTQLPAAAPTNSAEVMTEDSGLLPGTQPPEPSQLSPPSPSAPAETGVATAVDPLVEPADASALDLDEALLLDRSTAPTPEEMQQILEAEGVAMPPALAAELANFDTLPTDEELEALFEKHGLGRLDEIAG